MVTSCVSGLPGHGLPGLGDHRQRAGFALRRVDQHQVIGEFDEDAVMRLAGEEPHALADRRQVTFGAAAGGAGALADAGAARSPASPPSELAASPAVPTS